MLLCFGSEKWVERNNDKGRRETTSRRFFRSLLRVTSRDRP
jgi:hypothetical protein